MMKGIIFTIDAIVAITLAIGLITATYFFITNTQVSYWDEKNLNQMLMDSLAVLELNGDLGNAVESGNTTILSTYLNNIHTNRICSRIVIYDINSSVLYSVTKSGCSASDYISVARRTFASAGGIYFAKMEGWYAGR